MGNVAQRTGPCHLLARKQDKGSRRAQERNPIRWAVDGGRNESDAAERQDASGRSG